MKETVTTTIDDVIETRVKNPFWSAFTISFILMNWKLVIYSIYEFNNINFVKFKEHLVADWWLLLPLAIGIINLMFSQAIAEFCKALSANIHNKATYYYIKILNDKVIAKSVSDERINEIKSQTDIIIKNKDAIIDKHILEKSDLISKNKELDHDIANLMFKLEQMESYKEVISAISQKLSNNDLVTLTEKGNLNSKSEISKYYEDKEEVLRKIINKVTI